MTGGKLTKLKKPYLEQLIFHSVQHGLIPILRSVGVFPKLMSHADKIIPQLKTFHEYYDNQETNTKKDIKLMAQWIGEELTKSPPTNNKKGYKKK